MIEQLKELNIGEVLENVDLKKYNTYRICGVAKAIVFPNNLYNLIELIKYLRNNNIKYKILGKGSNLIFDDGYDGVLIKLDKFDKFEINGNEMTIGAGCSLIKASNQLSRLGYTGFEFATGIPGTLGGAVFMNAGAYKSDMGYIIKSVKILTPELKIKELTNYELDFHYRTSYIQKHPDNIILEATIILKRGNTDEIMQLIDDRKKRRIESQPLEYPSAGSVFRNPEGDFAGRLIEESGLKGKQIGGAMVSTKHANFIINYDKATGKEIKELILLIKSTIKDKYNIDLKCEQEFVE